MSPADACGRARTHKTQRTHRARCKHANPITTTESVHTPLARRPPSALSAGRCRRAAQAETPRSADQNEGHKAYSKAYKQKLAESLSDGLDEDKAKLLAQEAGRAARAALNA